MTREVKTHMNFTKHCFSNFIYLFKDLIIERFLLTDTKKKGLVLNS